MILAWILGETELISQVPTMLSHLIQAWIDYEDVTNGDDKVDVPSAKPSLLSASKVFWTKWAQAG